MIPSLFMSTFGNASNLLLKTGSGIIISSSVIRLQLLLTEQFVYPYCDTRFEIELISLASQQIFANVLFAAKLMLLTVEFLINKLVNRLLSQLMSFKSVKPVASKEESLF